SAGEQGTARLFDDQGWYPRLHAVTGDTPAAARATCELRGAGSGVDAAQSGGPAGGRRGVFRRRQPDETAGATRRDCAGLRRPRFAADVELHYRRNPAGDRRLWRLVFIDRRRRPALVVERARLRTKRLHHILCDRIDLGRRHCVGQGGHLALALRYDARDVGEIGAFREWGGVAAVETLAIGAVADHAHCVELLLA